VNGKFAIHKLGVKGAKVVGTLLRIDVFTVLSPNNANLESRLSKSITEMKRTGELDRLKKEFELDSIKNGIDPD
jgi:hypothetical protein